MIMKWHKWQVQERLGQRKAGSERKRVTKKRTMLGNTITQTESRKKAHYHGKDVLHKNIVKGLRDTHFPSKIEAYRMFEHKHIYWNKIKTDTTAVVKSMKFQLWFWYKKEIAVTVVMYLCIRLCLYRNTINLVVNCLGDPGPPQLDSA